MLLVVLPPLAEAVYDEIASLCRTPLDKKLEQVQQNCHQDLQILAGQDFACAADAIAAAEKLINQDEMASTLKYSDSRKTSLCETG